MNCPICGAPATPLQGYEPLALEWCASCEFAFRGPNDVQAEHDEEYFHTYGQGTAFDDDQKRREARVRLDYIGRHIYNRGYSNSPYRLLEIGSGAGHFLAEASAAKYQPTGIEQSAYAVEHGVQNGTPVRVGLVEDVELEPESFEVVCGWHVVEHMADPLPVLRRLHEALAPGGSIFLEVPNFSCPRARREGLGWIALDPDHHAGHHSPKSIRLLLERAGFANPRTVTTSAWAYMDPRRRLQPKMVARRLRYCQVSRTLPWPRHPSRLDLLRVHATR